MVHAVGCTYVYTMASAAFFALDDANRRTECPRLQRVCFCAADGHRRTRKVALVECRAGLNCLVLAPPLLCYISGQSCLVCGSTGGHGESRRYEKKSLNGVPTAVRVPPRAGGGFCIRVIYPVRGEQTPPTTTHVVLYYLVVGPPVEYVDLRVCIH